MGKESSFDIVSEIDFQEVDNALNQARREVQTRYDLKTAGCSIDYDQSGNELTLRSRDEFSLKSVADVVQSKLVKRGIDGKALHLDPPAPAAGGQFGQAGRFEHGISKDLAREITKLLKQTKMKINTAIQGDQVRVSGKNRDDLQTAIAKVKEHDFGVPLQFKNYR